jgi:hypothetical protein
MQVGVMQQVRTPGVKHGEKADLGAPVAGDSASIGSIETAAYVTCCSCRKRAPLDTAKRFSPIGTIYPSGLCRVPVCQPSISGKCAKSHTT